MARPLVNRRWSVSNRRSRFALLRRALADQGGSAAVELSLVLPVFLMFLFGFFEFCWTQHADASVRTALEQAARAVVINPALSSSSVQSMVQTQVNTLVGGTVTVTTTIATDANGKTATLVATYPHDIGIPGLPTLHVNYQTTVKAGLPTF